MARILIIGGGQRALQLTRLLDGDCHAVRVATRGEERRGQIEQAGGECFIGDPNRLATLRAALEGVTIACWLLSRISAGEEEITALHGSRLEFFLSQIIDTTVRGFVYEGHPGTVGEQTIAAGAQIARAMTSRNSIPLAVIQTDPEDEERWVADAHAAINSLLH